MHYAQFRGQNFVENAKVCIVPEKTAVFPQKRLKYQFKGSKIMKVRTRVFAMILVIALALSFVGCGSSGGSDNGKVNLTFQIWDVAVLPKCPNSRF